jgi:hypothetical protein
MRAALIVAASLPDYTYTHVIMMRGKRAEKRVGAIRLFWTRHTYTNEMDSGHTRSISFSTSSQYVLDHHSMWIKKYAARFEAQGQRTKHRLFTTERCFILFLIRLTSRKQAYTRMKALCLYPLFKIATIILFFISLLFIIDGIHSFSSLFARSLSALHDAQN